jgi:hypothetical protein
MPGFVDVFLKPPATATGPKQARISSPPEGLTS